MKPLVLNFNLESSEVDTLLAQVVIALIKSGYGANRAIVIETLNKFESKEPLHHWDVATLANWVQVFLDTRFPTVVALNKIDLADADKNIDRIYRKYDQVG